jgi:hypothetical protein
MFRADKSKLSFAGRCRLVIAVLAICLAGFATVAAAFHTDSGVDRDCPICQLANLPVVKPAAIPQLPRPAFVERHVPPDVSLQELEAARTFSSPRAPPA